MRLTQEQVQERQRLESEGLRYCRSCDSVLPLASFGKGKSRGFQTYCRTCNWKKQKESIARKSPEEHRAMRNRQQQARRAAQSPTDPEENRRKNLMRYGLTPEHYEALLSAQGGRCAICGGRPTGNLHVDHDHNTGKVRGLLCGRCNPALGAFQDSPRILLAAVRYLEA